MSDVVIVDAVRSPVGKRNGSLRKKYSTDLLGDVLVAVLGRNKISGSDVGQAIGGCVNQLGMQASNVIRSAWLGAGLPLEVPAVTVNAQCGSAQEATTLADALIASGHADVVIACGVEALTQIPLGSPVAANAAYGTPRGGRYAQYFDPASQFEGAERIAEKWGITRKELEVFGKRSQDLAAHAWAEDRFAGQIVPIEAPVTDESGDLVGTTVFRQDEGLRPTTLEGLAGLKPNLRDRDPAFHTAGTTSQVSDGASAVLLMSSERAASLGVTPRARIVQSVLVGSDPELMLTGPIPATQKLMALTGLSLADFDVIEINEAFASVVLAWQRELGADLDKVNVNGGAIALGHPLGATGTILITKALNELERVGGRYALVTMCTGGGLGTGTVIERL
jgi:acetyl-CoA C-acetyltransferase